MPELTDSKTGKVYRYTFEYQGSTYAITTDGLNKIREITEPIPAPVYNCDYLIPLINAGEIIQVSG